MGTMDNAVRPTKKQRALLDYIQAFIDQHGYSPSYREIMNGCGYSSIATVAVHINNLISRGHLRKRDHSARSLELTGSAIAPASESNAGTPPESRWVIAKLETLVQQVASADETVTEAEQRQLLTDIRVLVAAMPVLGVGIPEDLLGRLPG